MRKFLLLAILIAACASVSVAQDRDPEFAAQFSINNIDTGLANFSSTTNGVSSTTTTTFSNNNNRTTAYGFDVSGVGYLNDYFGIEGDFSGHYKTKSFNVTRTVVTNPIVTTTTSSSLVDTRFRIYQFGGGPHLRFKTSNEYVTPFVHGILGAANSRVSFPNGGVNVADSSSTEFALKLGGGVDFGRRVAFRLSADYAPIFGSNNTGINGQGNSTANNFMFGVGVRFK